MGRYLFHDVNPYRDAIDKKLTEFLDSKEFKCFCCGDRRPVRIDRVCFVSNGDRIEVVIDDYSLLDLEGDVETHWVRMVEEVGEITKRHDLKEIAICPECAEERGLRIPAPEKVGDVFPVEIPAPMVTCSNPDCYRLNEGRPEPVTFPCDTKCPKCGEVPAEGRTN